MNVKTVVPLGAAVVLGLVAAIVSRQLVSTPQSPASPNAAASVHLTDIVVATHDIAPGSTLGEQDLTIARVETKNAPQNVAAIPSALFHRVAKIQIPKGQIVHESLLAEAGVSGGLPGVIKPGYRAMTIEVNEFTGVAGLLQPGNRIDIMARFMDGENGMTTRTVVQNIEIIAVGTELSNRTVATKSEGDVLNPDAPKENKAFARAITVLVTPPEAERLDLASANQARLVLRASTDLEKPQLAGATMVSLRGDMPDLSAPVQAAAHHSADDIFSSSNQPTFNPRRQSRSITVVRGGVVSEIEVEGKTKKAADNTQAGGNEMTAPVPPSE